MAVTFHSGNEACYRLFLSDEVRSNKRWPHWDSDFQLLLYQFRYSGIETTGSRVPGRRVPSTGLDLGDGQIARLTNTISHHYCMRHS